MMITDRDKVTYQLYRDIKVVQKHIHYKTQKNGRRLSRYINKQKQTKAETEERKQWLECIKQWQLKKDAQCIRIYGYGWHYD